MTKKRPAKKAGKKGKNHPDSNDSPVIIDDTGSTKIKQIGSTLDSLVSSGSVTFMNPLTSMTIVTIDASLNSASTPVTGTITQFTFATRNGVSTIGEIDDTGLLTLKIALFHKAKKKSDNPNQVSYVVNDSGACKKIKIKGDNTTNPKDFTPPAGTIQTMISLEFT